MNKKNGTNGKWCLILGLLCLTIIVLVGTYYDLQRRQRGVVTLVQIQASIDAQTQEISQLQDGGTAVSKQLLVEMQDLQREGTEPLRALRADIGKLREVVDANAVKLNKLAERRR